MLIYIFLKYINSNLVVLYSFIANLKGDTVVIIERISQRIYQRIF